MLQEHAHQAHAASPPAAPLAEFDPAAWVDEPHAVGGHVTVYGDLASGGFYMPIARCAADRDPAQEATRRRLDRDMRDPERGELILEWCITVAGFVRAEHATGTFQISGLRVLDPALTPHRRSN